MMTDWEHRRGEIYKCKIDLLPFCSMEKLAISDKGYLRNPFVIWDLFIWCGDNRVKGNHAVTFFSIDTYCFVSQVDPCQMQLTNRRPCQEFEVCLFIVWYLLAKENLITTYKTMAVFSIAWPVRPIVERNDKRCIRMYRQWDYMYHIDND